jgi:D-amino-acid dehydrogenase
MARTDAIVLGAGIVGTSVALQLVRRGLSVALVDRRAPGEETSYGNAGVLEGQTLFPPAFPNRLGDLLRIAFKRSAQANYHLSFLPKVAPWLLAYRRNTSPAGSVEFAETMRPLFARAVAAHETLLQEAGATKYLRKDGWIKLYRSERAFADTARERDYAAGLGIAFRTLDMAGALALEPSLAPVFSHAVHWPGAASLSNPLAVTRAYAALFSKLGGVILKGDADRLHRTASGWRIDTEEGALDTRNAVLALGPWSPELAARFGLSLPMKWKRGYHRHYRAQGNAALTRPIVDTAHGYCLVPMEQGIRITTGAEFAHRDAPKTPVQLDRLMPAAKALFPLGEGIEAEPWMGARPCFADSRPVIGPVPDRNGLWLAAGHAHWGLTLGPVTGLLLADLIAGETPFCDPAPYGAARFG